MNSVRFSKMSVFNRFNIVCAEDVVSIDLSKLTYSCSDIHEAHLPMGVFAKNASASRIASLSDPASVDWSLGR